MIESVTTLLRVVEMAAVLAMGCALYFFSRGERRRVLRLWSAAAVSFVVREGALLAMERRGEVALREAVHLAIAGIGAEVAIIVLVLAGGLELWRAGAVNRQRLTAWIGAGAGVAALVTLVPGTTTRAAVNWSAWLSVFCALSLLAAAIPVVRMRDGGARHGQRMLLCIIPPLAIERLAAGYMRLAPEYGWPSPVWLAWLPLAELVLITVGFLATVVLLLEREQAETREQSAAAADAQRALADSQVWFQEMINGSTDIVTMLNESATILYESPSLGRVLGWNPEDLVGQSGLTYVHEDDVTATAAAFDRVVRRESATARVKYRFRARDGRFRILESEGREIAPSGGERRFVVTSRDVTEREELEERLLHSEKMESVGRLAGGVAHDFNNLLTVIMSNTALARATISTEHPAAVDLDQISDAAGRAARLTSQLLAFSRRQAVELQRVDLNAVVTRLVDMLRRLVGERVTLDIDLDALVPATMVDVGQVEQVMVNLVVNARDAVEPSGGGIITIRTRRLVVEAPLTRSNETVEPGLYVSLEVADTGGGVASTMRDHLFEPFCTTKEPGKGTGLGLATCYGIVKRHGGHIWHEDGDSGALFVVCFPAAAAAAEAPVLPQLPSIDGLRGSERVLVVEDDPMVRQTTHRILTEFGYDVVEAPDGEEALQLLDRMPTPDLVITDLVMPVLDGVELSARMRQRWPQLPVILVSGYTNRPESIRQASSPITRYLSKPFSPTDLLQVMRGMLDMREVATT